MKRVKLQNRKSQICRWRLFCLPGGDQRWPFRRGSVGGGDCGALGFAFQGGDPRNLLLRTLSQKQLLLILDNFEHLLVEGVAAQLEAVDLVVDLMNAAPGVQIIVTVI
jgi:hypothetical protein